MDTLRLTPALGTLSLTVALLGSGCSLFFNPDNHVTTDASTDSGVDSGIDSAVDSAMDSGMPDAIIDAGPPPFICDSDDPVEGAMARTTGPIEVSVAITDLGTLAHIAYVEDGSAMVDEAPFVNLSDTATWNVTEALRELGEPEPPFATSFAIRRYGGDQLGMTIAGVPASATSDKTGFFVGASPGSGAVSGLVLGSGGGTLGEGLLYSTLIGGGAGYDAEVRGVFVEENPDYPTGLDLGSLPLSTFAMEDYANLGVGLPRGPTFVSGSSGRLALVAIPGSDPPQATMWTGFGVSTGAVRSVSSIPYHSHIALIEDDTYLVTNWDRRTQSLTHNPIDCSFECETDNRCTLDDVVPRVGVSDPFDVDELLVATHHVPDLGVAVVTAEETSDATGLPTTTVFLEFLRPDLEFVPEDDADGDDFVIVLGEFPDRSPGAIDVDAWVTGGRLQVLVGVQLVPDDGAQEVLMLGWTGEFCR